ncbi:hypothetical protein, partial [Arhodomonas sp. AD133]|uniref:hypothetical protein n=1 Tax=Arhodomonas sp. AD133 TaxID=3415009 RepID=UPI003EB93C0C
MVSLDRVRDVAVRWVAAFLVVCLACLATANAAPSPDSDVLWVADTGGVLKVAATDAAIELEIPDARRVKALAADAARGLVWAYRPGRLVAYDLAGGRVRNLPVEATLLGRSSVATEREARDESRADVPAVLDEAVDGLTTTQRQAFGTAAGTHLAVDETTGEVWLVDGRSVYRYGADGERLAEATLGSRARDAAFVASEGSLWLTDWRGRVLAVSASGDVREPLDLGFLERALALAYAPQHDAVWIALPRAVVRHAVSGERRLTASVDGALHLDADGQGGVWAAGLRRLTRIDASGSAAVSFRPRWASALRGVLFHLAADPADASVWVSGLRGVAHFSADGEALAELDYRAERRLALIRAITTGADVIPPALAFTRPADGDHVDTRRPELGFEFDAGARAETLALRADGGELPVDCTPGNETADCVPTADLPEGPVNLSATIADAAGNESDPAKLALTVDTVPPALTVDAPSDGTLTNEPETTVRGQVNEAADVEIDGTAVFLDLDHRFEHTLTLDEGENTLLVEAIDPAGHLAEAQVGVTLDTIAPDILVDHPGDGHITNEAALTVQGSLSEPAELRIDGATVEPDANNGFEHALTLTEGGNAIELVATDEAGNEATRTLDVTLDTVAPAPVAGDRVSVTGDGSGQAVVTGAAGAVEAGARVTVTNTRTGERVTVDADAQGAFTATLGGSATDTYHVVVSDPAGNASDGTDVTGSGDDDDDDDNGGGDLPPDPGDVAPP